MNIETFANALSKLSHTELGGAKEAAVFFYVAAGAMTPADVIKLTGDRAGATRTRLYNLVEKGLIERKPSPRGKMLYALTRNGKKIVQKVIPQ
jgi:DNA-binding MarR family transcriptional regulator